MITQGTISFVQVVSLCVVNLFGIVLVGLIILLNRIIPQLPNKKIILSIGVGLISQGIVLVGFLDLGIFLWVGSRNFSDVFSIMPLSLCIIPFLFPVVVVGTYIQLTYGEKIREHVYSSRK